MRKYLRSIARHNMEKAGLKQINKKFIRNQSLFSLYWRKWISEVK